MLTDGRYVAAGFSCMVTQAWNGSTSSMVGPEFILICWYSVESVDVQLQIGSTDKLARLSQLLDAFHNFDFVRGHTVHPNSALQT